MPAAYPHHPMAPSPRPSGRGAHGRLYAHTPPNSRHQPRSKLRGQEEISLAIPFTPPFRARGAHGRLYAHTPPNSRHQPRSKLRGQEKILLTPPFRTGTHESTPSHQRTDTPTPAHTPSPLSSVACRRYEPYR